MSDLPSPRRVREPKTRVWRMIERARGEGQASGLGDEVNRSNLTRDLRKYARPNARVDWAFISAIAEATSLPIKEVVAEFAGDAGVELEYDDLDIQRIGALLKDRSPRLRRRALRVVKALVADENEEETDA